MEDHKDHDETWPPAPTLSGPQISTPQPKRFLTGQKGLDIVAGLAIGGGPQFVLLQVFMGRVTLWETLSASLMWRVWWVATGTTAAIFALLFRRHLALMISCAVGTVLGAVVNLLLILFADSMEKNM